MKYFVWITIIALILIAGSATAEEEQWIPAAASSPGALGTIWTTDLWIASRVIDAPMEVRAAFLPELDGTIDPVEVVIEIEPMAHIEILDAVATLFGENRPGAIRLRSEHPFIAQSRTANGSSGSGTFGQGIPAFEMEDVVEGGVFVGASNLPGQNGRRTNIGIVNIGDETEEVWISARDGETLEVFGLETVEIGPNGWYQTNVFELLGEQSRTIELAEVEFFAPGAELLAYLSRVDNRSGDPAFLTSKTKTTVRVVPRAWEVEAILTSTGSAVVERFEYTGASGTVVIDNPGSDYTTGVLDFMSTMEFCTRVVGEIGSDATGGVEVEIRYRAEGEPWGSHRHLERTTSTNPGGDPHPVDFDLCETLD